MYFHYEKRNTNNSFKIDITATSKSQRHLYLQLSQLKKSAFRGKHEGASTENNSERWNKINRARKYKDKYDIKLLREKVHKRS